jgi:predicted RNA-binding Zn-ribbon protein involved in translation (DUF1610 family)
MGYFYQCRVFNGDDQVRQETSTEWNEGSQLAYDMCRAHCEQMVVELAIEEIVWTRIHGTIYQGDGKMVNEIFMDNEQSLGPAEVESPTTGVELVESASCPKCGTTAPLMGAHEMKSWYRCPSCHFDFTDDQTGGNHATS